MDTENDTLENLCEYLKEFIPSKKYDEGYETGLNWPDIWENHGKPGGPYISSNYIQGQGWRYNQKSREENQDWCRGWEDGHKEKLKTKRSNGLPKR